MNNRKQVRKCRLLDIAFRNHWRNALPLLMAPLARYVGYQEIARKAVTVQPMGRPDMSNVILPPFLG